MDEIIIEHFKTPVMNEKLAWKNPPNRWEIDAERGRLVVFPDDKTDYWQKTGCGLSTDNGHFLFTECGRDFSLSTHVTYRPENRYDQAGLMVRASPDFWLKTSVELEEKGVLMLGTVVTSNGYSDWSTQRYEADPVDIHLQVERRGDDYTVSTGRNDAERIQIRLCRLKGLNDAPVQCGLYACSPVSRGFAASFGSLEIRIMKPRSPSSSTA